MSNWPGLTNGQTRDLARDLAVAIMNAIKHKTAPPGDEWLDVRLRASGCPEIDLATWRARIMATPLASIADERED
jgi:hypothetical protein